MKLTLIKRVSECAGVESFIFQPAEPFSWKAGQFLHYVLHHEPTDTRGSDRWFTAASAPFEGNPMITTRLAAEKGSSFKRALTKLKVSEEIEISDVDGDFIVEDPNTSCVFLAGGIGVTPFHSILKQADHEGVQLNVVMLYANRDENVPYKEEFDQFAERNPRLVIHYLTSPERIDETSIKKYAPDLAQPTFYVSGPEPMVESLGTMLKSLGVPPEHLKQDWFPGYPAE